MTSVFAAQAGGKWCEYVGGFSDWQVQRERSERIAEEATRQTAKEAPKDDAPKDSAAGRNAQRTVRLSFKEQRELERLPERIAALEAEQTSIGVQLADSSIFAKDAKEGAPFGTACGHRRGIAGRAGTLGRTGSEAQVSAFTRLSSSLRL